MGFHCTFLNFYFYIMTVKPNLSPCRRHPFCARLLSNNRVTTVDHWQDVRLVQFDIKGSGMRYSTLCTHNKIVDTSRFSILNCYSDTRRITFAYIAQLSG